MDVRIAPAADAAPVRALAVAMGWAEHADDLARKAALQPEGQLVAYDAAGRPIGAGACLVWPAEGGGAAWLGGMMVLPEARRQGVGRALLDALLGHAEAKGARSVSLCATDEGRGLYERAGFRAVAPMRRWRRAAPEPGPPPRTSSAIYPISSCEIMELWAYDRPRFGASRAPWLADLMARFPERAFVAFDRASGRIAGHAMADAHAVGPLVADTPEAAAWLLHACERAGAPPVVLEDARNPGAAPLLEARGYAPADATLLMVRGEPPAGVPSARYGLAGWSLG